MAIQRFRLFYLMLEARIYDDLYFAVVDTLLRRERDGQPTTAIKAVRLTVQERSQYFLRRLFTSLDSSSGAIASDIHYYIGRLNPFSIKQFTEAWTGVLAAVTLDHMEQTKTTRWKTESLLDDFNLSVHSSTPLPPFRMEQLIKAGNDISNERRISLPGKIWVNDNLATVMLRRGMGIAGELPGQNLTPPQFFDEAVRIMSVKPLAALIHSLNHPFDQNFVSAARKLGGIAKLIEER